MMRGASGLLIATVALGTGGCMGDIEGGEAAPVPEQAAGGASGRTVQATDPFFLFETPSPRAFPGIRMLMRDELARSIQALTGVTPVVDRLPPPSSVMNL